MKKPCKAEFLTIPDAPNYEINGYFKVRNKITGKLIRHRMKNAPDSVGGVSLKTKDGGHKVFGLLKAYRTAVDAFLNEDGEWASIESTKNRYEMNIDGVVRNAKSKYIIKPYMSRGVKFYKLLIDGKCRHVSLKKLLNEVFGKHYPLRRKSINVILRKDGLAYFFKTMAAGATFLSKKVYFAVGTIKEHMCNREKKIFGWQVTYLG